MVFLDLQYVNLYFVLGCLRIFFVLQNVNLSFMQSSVVIDQWNILHVSTSTDGDLNLEHRQL